MITKIGRLTQEDRARFLLIVSRSNALETNPRAYSAQESEGIVRAELALIGEFLDRYDIDATRDWKLSKYTGDWWYED